MKGELHHILSGAIRAFVHDRMHRETVRTRWRKPLVGFADAADALFERLKTAVRPSHAVPSDLLSGARTVIVYFLPFERDIVRSNRQSAHASAPWAVAYVETNQLIRDVNRHLCALLAAKGFACADLPPTHNFDTEQLMSDWSHKHAAYIAGLGTFGTHHLLITDSGCCGRFGSLITDAAIRPTERTDGTGCLAKYNGTCGVCIKRCAAGALTEAGFDRHRCYALLLENAELHRQTGLADVCGKCSAVVPCSFHNPVRRLQAGERKNQPAAPEPDQ